MNSMFCPNCGLTPTVCLLAGVRADYREYQMPAPGLDDGHFASPPSSDENAPELSAEAEMEIADDELLSDDEEPHSQSRPSSAGLLPARAKAATAAGASAQRSLRDLLRTVQFLSASLQTTCDKTDTWVLELQAFDGALDAQAQSQRELCERVTELQRELAQTRDRAAEERQQLVAEQDAFIASLVADHEVALAALKSRAESAEAELAALRPAPADPSSAESSDPK